MGLGHAAEEGNHLHQRLPQPTRCWRVVEELRARLAIEVNRRDSGLPVRVRVRVRVRVWVRVKG